MPVGRLTRVVFTTAATAALLAPCLSAQDTTSELFAGDSIRVDGELVGRVLSIEGQNLTMVSRGKPQCRAGLMHGDAPVCDPAPIRRETMALNDVSVERRMQKGHLTMRTVLGGVLGAAAFGAAGYFIGPSFGFGKIDGCVEVSASQLCSNPVDQDVLRADQKISDQRRGAFFFGLLGGSFTAIMARKLSVGWVRVAPSVPVAPTDPWSVSFTVPAR